MASPLPFCLVSLSAPANNAGDKRYQTKKSADCGTQEGQTGKDDRHQGEAIGQESQSPADGRKQGIDGAQAIMTEAASVIIAGGMENMSNVPYALPRARWGYRMDLSGMGEIYDLMVLDGLFENFYGYHLGITAENIAEKYKISRQEQDEFQQRVQAELTLL
jgi:hypothetical protein